MRGHVKVVYGAPAAPDARGQPKDFDLLWTELMQYMRSECKATVCDTPNARRRLASIAAEKPGEKTADSGQAPCCDGCRLVRDTWLVAPDGAACTGRCRCPGATTSSKRSGYTRAFC
jgi:hypothetical protein